MTRNSLTDSPESSWPCTACWQRFPNLGALGNHGRYSKECTPEKRFWGNVDKSAGPDACWLYMGFRKWDGYGWVKRGRFMGAHRYAWILTNGEPAKGQHVLHKCDNPPCCNPAHLRLGTHQDNMADQRAKGRAVRGERSKRNKLTYEQVCEIRRLYAEGWTTKALSERFPQATREAISHVVKRRTWKVDAPSPTLHPDRVRPKRAAS